MSDKPIKIQRALISVSDKSGLEQLGNALLEHGVEILSSGGTAKFFMERKIRVREISDFTQAPEMLDGRLKTLHPKVHGGILAIRNNSEHMKSLSEQGYLPIDLVIVNLYPFEKVAAKRDVPLDEVIEQIDIGGPTLLRAAAKNYPFVTVLVSPDQYDLFLQEYKNYNGATSLGFREQAARRVFERTALYDSSIARYLQGDTETAPVRYPLGLEQKWELRYGENPHQTAGFYLPASAMGHTALEKILQGKTLSYNNLIDIHAALDLICEFEDDFVVAILKHTNPCGVGRSTKNILEAYERALACDPVSAFGGIIVFSQPVDGKTAEICSKTFTEIVIAPSYDASAREIFSKKKNLRLLEVDLKDAKNAMKGFDIRRAADGYLIQGRDLSANESRRMPNELDFCLPGKSPDMSNQTPLSWRISTRLSVSGRAK